MVHFEASGFFVFSSKQNFDAAGILTKKTLSK